MQSTAIEWCDMTWNPIVGCAHGCGYCYAQALNKRFHYIPDWKKPQFFPERLHELEKIRIPKNIYDIRKAKGWNNQNLHDPLRIFVGSMCDIFSPGIPEGALENIANICGEYPSYDFMFLTKNPRYGQIKWPKNVWLGVTVTTKSDDYRIHYLRAYKESRRTVGQTFVSVEPILGDFTGVYFSQMDMVVVGAQTGRRAIKPQKEWIESIHHHNLFYKNSIKSYLS